MTRTRKQPQTYNGFAIPLQPDTELGLAMLIAKDDDGATQPIAVASTINEAKDIAESDMRDRMHRLERREEAGICPARYTLRARGVNGEYRIAMTIDKLTEVPPARQAARR